MAAIWGLRGRWNIYAAAAVLGLACAALAEHTALAAGRWSYTERMPVAATSNNIAASAHFLDFQVVGWSQRNERSFIMNHTDGWMGGWAGGGMWVWTVAGVLVVVVLVIVINKLSKK